VRDHSTALFYLRRSVINKSRSVLRRRVVADRLPLPAERPLPSAEDSALAVAALSAVRAALRGAAGPAAGGAGAAVLRRPARNPDRRGAGDQQGLGQGPRRPGQRRPPDSARGLSAIHLTALAMASLTTVTINRTMIACPVRRMR